MSDVTDIILTTMINDGMCEGERLSVDSLRDYFVKVDGYAGGDKTVQADVFLAAVNFCDEEKLIEDFKKVKWEYPECAQLFLKGEDEDVFAVHIPNS